MNKIEEIFFKSESWADYAKHYVSYLSQLLISLDFKAIAKVVEVFQNARANARTIFFVGNGGSAATCSHFAEDLACVTPMGGKEPFKALSLTGNVAHMTAIANDEGYENVFVGQLKNLFKRGDVLVGISGSGNSPNVIRAIEYVNSNGGISIGLLGFDGGKMKEICHYYIHVKTMKGEYGPVEDIHLILGHLITTYFKSKIREE